MVIGNGLIANLFKDSRHKNCIYFASGVSNSLEIRKEEFEREENLILETMNNNPELLFIYFSSCSIYDSTKNESPYVLHKLKMEQLIKNTMKKWLILRVSNAVGNGGNPNLLMNYLVRSVKNDKVINVHTKATRNLIDAKDIKSICNNLIENNKENHILNIAYLDNYSIIEIIEVMESYYSKKIKINLIKSGTGYDINIPEIENYFYDNNLENKEKYLIQILNRYYN
ncbi:NAD-dependent epimerase/dehydratase family protein [Epilithonimonas sp.]|uniref:NAD-dependent epimerase/dehydratase family protein n=1 Tax=Epilithonimonas sp. TaxID=2894511 RepID=UPI002FDDD15B